MTRTARRLAALLAITTVGLLPGAASGQAELVKVGVRADAKPFSFRSIGKSFEGYMVEFCRAVLASENLPYQFVDVTAEDRFELLRQGKVDVLCGPTTINLARLEEFDFSQILFVAGISYMAARRPGGQQTKGDAGARVVGVLRGTTAEEVVQSMKQAGVFGGTPDAVEIDRKALSHVTGIREVCAGTIDFYVGDRDILSEGMAGTPDCSAVLSDLFYSYEPYALAFSPNSGDLARVFRRGIYRMFSDGIAQRAFERYFPGRRPTPFLTALFQLNRVPAGKRN